jgi:GAF domain-containing protein
MALRRLRSSVHTAAIPIIALVIDGATKQELLTAGAEVCLDLPIEDADIIQALESHLPGGHVVQGAPTEIIHDATRLAALDATGMMDSDDDEELDILTRLAARMLGTPVALVSLVDERRQFFKSQVGLPSPWDKSRETPLSHSFCQWVVSSDQELVVPDARTHQVLSENGAVSDLGVVAYAGVPIKATEGETIGSFCAIDTNPRNWSDEELAVLRDLGQLVDAYLAINQYQKFTDKTLRNYASTTQIIAKGFLGAARFLQRCGDSLEQRKDIAGIISRQSQQLLDMNATTTSQPG